MSSQSTLSERRRAGNRLGRRGLAEQERAAIVRRLLVTGAILVVVMVVGAFVYRFSLDVSWINALYMTVITVTTVGFSEVAELNDADKLFTITLIVTGFGTVSYGAVTAGEFVIEGHLRNLVEQRRMERQIGNLRKHIIVCGYGRVGRHVVDNLLADRSPFVVVENDEAKVAQLQERGLLHVIGDATEEHVLEDAGLDAALAVVAGVNADAENVLITLTAKGLRPDVVVIARSKADENERKLERAGADRVIAPATIGGKRIAQILTRPAVADFVDNLGQGGVDYTLEEVPVTSGSSLEGRNLREAGIRETWGVSVVAIKHTERTGMDMHPAGHEVLDAGDVLVVMGSEEDVTRMRNQFVVP